MPPAARLGDNVLQTAPHCHAPIHPAAPTPTPAPHPALPLAITAGCSPTVFIDGAPAATVTSVTAICSLPTCVPNGPGIIQMGSTTVLHGGLPAARANDPSLHAGCIAPIPSVSGKIIPPCSTTVMIGG